MIRVKKKKPSRAVALIERVSVPRPQGGGMQHIVVTPAGLAEVERMAKAGMPKVKIAARLGVSTRAFYNMLEETDGEEATPLRLAWERGYADNQWKLIADLQDQAANGYSPAAMFLLKTRHGYRENDTPQVATLGVNIINLPRNLTPEEYRQKMIDVTPPKGAG